MKLFWNKPVSPQKDAEEGFWKEFKRRKSSHNKQTVTVKLRSKFKWKMKRNEKRTLRQTERCNFLQQALFQHPKIFTLSIMRPTNATLMQDLKGTLPRFCIQKG